MIAKREIRALLADMESEKVERTVSTNNMDKFAKVVCAFANDLSNKRRPGYLIIGANDNGSLCGLKVTDELCRNLAGLRSDGNILPSPALLVEKISFPEGDVAVVEVQPSKQTPVKYKGTTYIRIGARKGEANDEEIRILQEKSEIKAPTFDSTPCLYSNIDDLDLELFKTDYLPKFVKKPVLTNDKRTIKQQLASLKLFDIKHDCPTVAGILLVGKDTKQILFGSYIQFVEFAGQNRASKVLNERQFSGNLITMLRELDYFIKYTIQKQRPVFITVLREEMRINYPYEAIRELAMNMVMHRNYNTNAPSKFYEYADRIEMDNPGNLFGKVTPDNFPNETDYRNPVIANAMKMLGYVNEFGSGINSVQEILAANKNGYAQFYFQDMSTFKVIVTNADPENKGKNVEINDEIVGIKGRNVGINDETVGIKGRNVGINDETVGIKGKNVGINDETVGIKGRNVGINDEILEYINKNQNVTIYELAFLLKVAPRTIERYINLMRKNGVIERIGARKNGYWKILNKREK